MIPIGDVHVRARDLNQRDAIPIEYMFVLLEPARDSNTLMMDVVEYKELGETSHEHWKKNVLESQYWWWQKRIPEICMGKD